MVWRTCYFLIHQRLWSRGVYQTFFVKRKENVVLSAQVHVDDFVFGATTEKQASEFSKLMQSEFQMSMIWVLQFFHNLQVQQKKDVLFALQITYAKELVKKISLKMQKLLTPYEYHRKIK